MSRLNVSLSNETAKNLENEARRQGKTVSSIVGEASRMYLEMESSGISVEHIRKTLLMINVLKATDSVPVPSILLDSIIKLALKTSEAENLNKWFDRGEVVGSIIKQYAPDIDALKEAIDNMSQLLPSNMIRITKDNSDVEIMLSGAGYSIEAAKCTCSGIKGFLKSYGVRVQNEDSTEGFVRVNGVIDPDNL
ncbi:MAG: hypothetical protein ACYDCP_04610 [Thermoplasmataceae archaeon]|jgi:hypothetical protein